LSKPPLIAIVDDDEGVREALCDLLEAEGLSAHTFDSAIALLADAMVEQLDCLITDVRMPEMDGLELQQRLRARGCSTAVIFITASTHEETRVRAMLDGAVAWFTKPVSDVALLHELKTVLERRGAPRQS